MTNDTTRRVCEAVDEVARFADAARLARSSFHLSRCGGCGCPSFHQPCSLCGFYPSGSDKGTWSPKEATAEQFVAMVERSGPGGVGGTIATWHARDEFLSAAWTYRAAEAKAASEVAADAASALRMPSAAEVWEVVSANGTFVGRAPADAAVLEGWRGLEELWRTVLRATESRDAGPSTSAALRTVEGLLGRWVEAVHSGDRDAMSETLETALQKMDAMRGPAFGPGNMDWARRAIESARDQMDAASPSP